MNLLQNGDNEKGAQIGLTTSGAGPDWALVTEERRSDPILPTITLDGASSGESLVVNLPDTLVSPDEGDEWSVEITQGDDEVPAVPAELDIYATDNSGLTLKLNSSTAEGTDGNDWVLLIARSDTLTAGYSVDTTKKVVALTIPEASGTLLSSLVPSSTSELDSEYFGSADGTEVIGDRTTAQLLGTDILPQDSVDFHSGVDEVEAVDNVQAYVDIFVTDASGIRVSLHQNIAVGASGNGENFRMRINSTNNGVSTGTANGAHTLAIGANITTLGPIVTGGTIGSRYTLEYFGGADSTTAFPNGRSATELIPGSTSGGTDVADTSFANGVDEVTAVTGVQSYVDLELHSQPGGNGIRISLDDSVAEGTAGDVGYALRVATGQGSTAFTVVGAYILLDIASGASLGDIATAVSSTSQVESSYINGGSASDTLFAADTVASLISPQTTAGGGAGYTGGIDTIDADELLAVVLDTADKEIQIEARSAHTLSDIGMILPR